MEWKFDLGEEVEDKVTGFTGTVTSRSEFLNGCIQYGVMPKMKKGENKKPSAELFDEAQIKSKNKKVKIKKSKTGGPMPEAALIRGI